MSGIGTSIIMIHLIIAGTAAGFLHDQSTGLAGWNNEFLHCMLS